MCGIAGILSRGGTISDEQLVHVAKALSSRGPDASSWTHCEQGLALLHTRLKILDLRDDANQPMMHDDERYTLVFNGEIYNFKELRGKMEAAGEIFSTTCDTEVLLRHLVLNGCTKDSLAALNGMFAFAFHDKVAESVWLARDRLGIKPMFYAHSEDESRNKFVFASNINALLKANVSCRGVDADGVSMYISFRSPLGAKTMFSDIKKLSPGHCMRLDTKTGLMDIEQYWDLPLPPRAAVGEANADENRTDCFDEGMDFACSVRARMQQAVELEMVADVPICSYLSGGVDSSVITSLMQRRFAKDFEAAGGASESVKKQVTTYTVGFSESNEFEYAKKVATVCDTNHKELLLSMPDYFETMVGLIAEKGEPLGVPNEVALYLMSCSLKRDGFSVVLSGEGADEIFHGYGRIFRLGHDYERVKRFEGGQKQYQEFKDTYHDYDTNSFADFFFQRYSYVSLSQKYSCFSSEFRTKIGSQSDTYALQLIRSVFDHSSHMPYQDQVSYAMLKLHLPVLLHRCDTCTMATGVEARVPFVNQTVVDYAFQLPPHSKMAWISERAEHEADLTLASKFSEIQDVPKAVLKEAFSSDLPDDILYRKKVGFPIPLKVWFAGSAKQLVVACVDKLCLKRHLFDAKMGTLARQFSEQSSESDTYFLWAAINLEFWYSLYIDVVPVDALTKWVKQHIFSDLGSDRLPSLLTAKRSDYELAAEITKNHSVPTRVDGDKECVKVETSEARQQSQGKSYDSLGIESLIPLSKVDVIKLSDNLTRRKVVLFESGSFCPPHVGHISLLENAKAWLEEHLDVDVVAGYLSPHSDIRKKFGGTEPLTKEERCQLCQAICSDSSWIMCDSYRCFANIAKTPETEYEFRKGPPAYLARDAIANLLSQTYGTTVEIWCLLGDDIVEMIQAQGFFHKGSTNTDLKKSWGHFTPVVCIPRSVASPCLQLAMQRLEPVSVDQPADIKVSEDPDVIQVYVCGEEQYIKKHGLTGTSTKIRNSLDRGLPITTEMGTLTEKLMWQLPGAISRLQESVKTDEDKPKIA